ncbi:MAG: hypothetical protein IH888_13370 [Planctomycetes bacterium]|nr:hypothetical protein [Planctomycetota bacterium]
MALDGEVMVIGAHGSVNSFPARDGAAFVFRFNGSNWVQEQKLHPPNFVPHGVFGYSVAVSGDTALIGDWKVNDSVGVAHVFVFNGVSWVQTAELVGSDAGDPEFGGTPPYFGLALSLVGSTAAIASPYHDSFQNGGDSGGVYMFDMDQVNCDLPCPWDLEGNGSVGVKDLLILLGVWGPCPPKGDCPADFDGSGDVGVKDLLILLGAWGPCP